MAENAHFFGRQQWMLPDFEVFNENEFPETSNGLDDSEISLFIEENRNVDTTKNWLKLTSMYGNDGTTQLKKQRPLKKFPPRNLTIFYVISFPWKSWNSTDSCLQQLHYCCWSEISTATSSKTKTRGYFIRAKMTEVKVRLDCYWTSCCLTLFDVTFEFCLFWRVLSICSFTRWPRTLLLI